MDTFSPAQRSWIMAQVRSSRNRTTEQSLVGVFRCHRMTGWRRNFCLFGKPDFVFPNHRLAIFVDGCFWHGHPTKCRLPKSNRDYWTKKILRNVTRDREVSRTLRKMGWRVLRIWEDSVMTAETIGRLRKALSI
ncbi:MAG: very short patch repair endonuclease [candidate division NC10 bacterium]|nr:very short patch repair endonuclease [candidate division NC10 bacterium]